MPGGFFAGNILPMISVEAFPGKSVSDLAVEIVERKGTGHPDFICDSIMESISVALSGEYKRVFGRVLHHNTDKGLLAAGRTENTFGGGRMVKPMELSIGDRATFSVGRKRIPVRDIAVKAAREWVLRNLRFVDPEKHIKYRTVLSPASEELSDIFVRPGALMGANDTSALIGYYPLSPTEEAVLRLERHLNSPQFKERYPETGEDVKVMGLRTGSDLDVTVAMPFICRFIHSEKEYFQRKKTVRSVMERFLKKTCPAFGSIDVHFNTLDEEGRGLGGIYLTLTGTSAESGDSGQVGRGNRVNGLISVSRPMGTEAAAGKNPVSHVGKIYNILAHKTAEKIYKNIDGVREVYVLLLSRIGRRIDHPLMASARVLPEEGHKLADFEPQVKILIEEELSDIAAFCDRLSEGKYPVC